MGLFHFPKHDTILSTYLLIVAFRTNKKCTKNNLGSYTLIFCKEQKKLLLKCMDRYLFVEKTELMLINTPLAIEISNSLLYMIMPCFIQPFIMCLWLGYNGPIICLFIRFLKSSSANIRFQPKLFFMPQK